MEKNEENIIKLINNSENNIMLGKDVRINLDGAVTNEGLGLDMKITTGTLDANSISSKNKGVKHMKLQDKVKIKNVNKMLEDSTLEKEAKEILTEVNFIGEVTKVEDEIYFVGFKNSKGWVTKGFKKDEIEVIK